MESDDALLEKIFKERLLAAETEAEQKFWVSCLVALWFNKMFEGMLLRFDTIVGRLIK